MKKGIDILLNILLILSLTFLFLHLFSGKPKPAEGITFSFQESSYSIPASPKLKISNYSSGSIQINTCKNIELSHNGKQIPFSKNFCRDITVPKSQEIIVDYGPEYTKFLKFGTYTMKVKLGEKEYYPSVKIENRGVFSKLFIAGVYAPIYNLVVWLMELFNHSFGWAIVGITIIIRLILLYPQQKMMVAQRKMQQVQPKLKALQEKYKDNKQELGMKVMELYKKEKVSPFSSCGILLIQLPILLVVYHIIVEIKDPANIYYLYSGLSSFDISKIDFSFYGLDLLQVGGIQGLILALIVAGIQYVQISLSLKFNAKTALKQTGVVLEKKKGEKDYSSMMPDPDLMNKILKYGMPTMVGIFTYTLFAGLGLYWGITTLFMLVQQLVVNKNAEK